MGHLVIYLCEKCQYLFDLEKRQGDSQDGGDLVTLSGLRCGAGCHDLRCVLQVQPMVDREGCR